MKDLSQLDLQELFEYDPDTGNCIWKVRDEKWFLDCGDLSKREQKRWNKRYARTKMGYISKYGYIHCYILKKNIAVHRLIWKYMTGETPNKIDHINGNMSDNSFKNLRNVTHSGNMRNRRIGKNNKSGFIGVHYHKATKKWASALSVDGKILHLGVFDTVEKAAEERMKASIKYGYHINHGRGEI